MIGIALMPPTDASWRWIADGAMPEFLIQKAGIGSPFCEARFARGRKTEKMMLLERL
jgi:hypothetical protein